MLALYVLMCKTVHLLNLTLCATVLEHCAVYNDIGNIFMRTLCVYSMCTCMALCVWFLILCSDAVDVDCHLTGQWSDLWESQLHDCQSTSPIYILPLYWHMCTQLYYASYLLEY